MCVHAVDGKETEDNKPRSLMATAAAAPTTSSLAPPQHDTPGQRQPCTDKQPHYEHQQDEQQDGLRPAFARVKGRDLPKESGDGGEEIDSIDSRSTD